MMKKQVLVCGLAALMIGVVSCKSQQSGDKKSVNESVAIGDNSRNALDWAGSYSTMLPCDDCGGVQISVDLSADGAYNMKEVYFGKDDANTDVSGKVTWIKDGNIITVGEGQAAKKFQVGENALFMLDADGNRMTGEQPDSYILGKTDIELVEKYWKLTELFGEPVGTSEGGNDAHIILKKEGNRTIGNGGCNGFSGSYTLKPGNRIKFSRAISTMRMCDNMDTETKLYQVFEMADNYVVKDDVLILNKARMAPLARFEAVCLK